MSLEERTLVVRNIDGDKLSVDLLDELFSNFGPVVKVVLRKNFAFIEFSVKSSVGYAWAMTEGLCLQGRQLRIAPKLEDDPFYYTYRDALNAFENRIANDPAYLDSLLTAEQHQERSGLLNGLNIRSSNVITNVQRRLRQYELHAIPKSTYNPIVQRDLAKECNNSNNSFFLSPRQQMDHKPSFSPQGDVHQRHPRSHSADGRWSNSPHNCQEDFNGSPYPMNHQGHFQQPGYGSQPNLNQNYHQPPPIWQQHHHPGPRVDCDLYPQLYQYPNQSFIDPYPPPPPHNHDYNPFTPVGPPPPPSFRPPPRVDYHHNMLPQGDYSPEFTPTGPPPNFCPRPPQQPYGNHHPNQRYY